MRKQPEYRIIGAYDSETTNITIDGKPSAFPMLHQLGLLDGTDLHDITPDNVESCVQVEYFRHSLDLYERLDDIVSTESCYVPVILCHNLSFDMYGLSAWLSRHDVRVLAKSARKPITFTINGDDGKPRLIIWDTLIFSQQPLERMGNDCGFSKAVGEWDYEKVRTPDTPLTDEELDYAKRDILTLICWVAWWIQRNPDIEASKLGLNVVTKTGIVRERRRVRFFSLKGKNMKRNCGYFWLTRCRLDKPKSNDELFTMLAATRGGFTFCSSVNASVPFNLAGTGKRVYAYDATSQHPAQIVSHYYPYRFREMPAFVLEQAFNLIGKITFERVLKMFDKPFPVAFYACFEFDNIRPKKDSLFERFGIMPLASARYKTPEQIAQDDDNGDRANYDEHMQQRSYCDSVEGARCLFGKIVSAEKARLYITELTAWEIWQAYEWDGVRAIHGYETGKFCKPSDMDMISVMQFYKAKNVFKEARKEFYRTGSIGNAQTLKDVGIAPAMVDEMKNGTASSNDVEAQYLSLKADLNSIFGLSCTNAYRRKTVLDSCGIEYVGEFGICNEPKTMKVWYQFGQRIVGWSRIAQIVVMQLIEPYVDTIVNGDTDSIKFVCKDENITHVDEALTRYAQALDVAKAKTVKRVKYAYPQMYDPLDEIGYYVLEFVTDRFCASWNKAYCLHDESGFSFTLAGIPTRRRVNAHECFIGVNGYADRLYKMGYTFEDICNLFLGYNVTFANDVIRLNARKFPEWGSTFYERVTDYLGIKSNVCEPASLSLYPMAKTVNDTQSPDNRRNMLQAIINNPGVNVGPKIICSSGVIDLGGLEDE